MTKLVQADVDGDHIFVISDPAFLDCLGEQKSPLYYNEMSKIFRLQEQKSINVWSVVLINENIGNVSNAITKILNEENPDIKLVRILCAYNNYVIRLLKHNYL